MQLDSYVEQVQQQLVAAAALGDDRVREVAATLAGAASPAIRLAVLTALSAAADEVTAALLDTAGSPAVSIRLDGDEATVVVAETAVVSPAEPAVRTDDGEASARISLRLSESLKADIDEAAAAAGLSVNAWLARAATTALGAPPGRSIADESGGRSAQRVTGWVSG